MIFILITCRTLEKKASDLVLTKISTLEYYQPSSNCYTCPLPKAV